MSQIRGVLLAGGFRTHRQLLTMPPEDQRNTLIVELAGRTASATSYYQGLDDDRLAGVGAVLVYLRHGGVRTDTELRTMSADDLRNTLIVVADSWLGRGSALQALDNIALVALALGRDRGYIRGALFAGRFRLLTDLARMSADDQRNTLIVELAGRTAQPGPFFQGLDDAALGAAGLLLVLLRHAGIRDDAGLRTMSVDDMRNTLIVELGAQTGLGAELQGLDNLTLVATALGATPLAPSTVHGAIGDRYRALGGARSWLGWPTTDEVDLEGGKVRFFQHGAIYWWPETGARELNEVLVQYSGLHCFGETDADGLSSADEPFVTVGAAIPGAEATTVRSQIYEEVDAGEQRVDVIDVYRGKPRGLLLSTVVTEHSSSDPEQVKTVVGGAVQRGGQALAGAATVIPVIGPAVAVLGAAAIEIFKDDITRALAALVRDLGFTDRPLGTDVRFLSPKQLVALATRPEGNETLGGIAFRVQTDLLSRYGASYKACFNIVAV